MIEYGNGARTDYVYDLPTFRLVNLRTTRSSDHAVLQDLYYAYDPVGNITAIGDDAQQTIYFSNQVVTPDNDYFYDAVYRLIAAAGREHIGQASAPQTTWDDSFRMRLPLPGDGQAMRRYSEEYRYDPAGNFLQLIHRAPIPQLPTLNGNWTRFYFYNEPSLLEPLKTNNRLSGTSIGDAGAPSEAYSHDEHGNMTSMPHLSLMQWDFRDQLSATARQVVNDGTPETTYYVYDATGKRARKITERQNGTRRYERIYLGGYEVYREYNPDGSSLSLERESLHVMDDKQRIALVETRTIGSEPDVPQQLIRYQFAQHLSSASLELDGTGQIISYEEYYPYGSTSYQSGRSVVEADLKRYRYTGMERDEESGLSYHSARYFASWLARWLSCDPSGLAGGQNLYAYVNNRPSVLFDPQGTDDDKSCFDPGVTSENRPECFIMINDDPLHPGNAPAGDPKGSPEKLAGKTKPSSQGSSSKGSGSSGSGSSSATGSSSEDGDLVKHAARGFLKGLAIGFAIALLPFELPFAIVGALLAAAVYSLVQSFRRRDFLNRPISTSQAVENGASIFGGFAGGFMGGEILPPLGGGPTGLSPALVQGEPIFSTAVPAPASPPVNAGNFGGVLMMEGGDSNGGDSNSSGGKSSSHPSDREFFDLDQAATHALGEDATVPDPTPIETIGPVKSEGVIQDLETLGYDPKDFRAVQYRAVSKQHGDIIITVFENDQGVYFGPHVSSQYKP